FLGTFSSAFCILYVLASKSCSFTLQDILPSIPIYLLSSHVGCYEVCFRVNNLTFSCLSFLTLTLLAFLPPFFSMVEEGRGMLVKSPVASFSTESMIQLFCT